MQISSRFTIAIHVLTCIYIFQKKHKITSDFLAGSVNVNPVVIRKLLKQLKNADLIQVTRGSGGTSITKSIENITLFDIYLAVECVENGQLFHFHENPNPACPIGNNIHSVLDNKLLQIQHSMENEMKKITIADIINDMKKRFSI
ncbi:Rrf2 family transcriptional regulator [Pectinatus brassicae]|uniref:DNA-binding IscR family transcriptional regulator n=1 Tax=Pectinatus brassicae TaxID=862415 RepID=A0A840ULF1_9FIRM|nr:Rrf2 family transcriptional regulator [Pectinatus brassicae]MBB5336587.1 DNA-binding IscR family transcriptional regulator [Pectinatus brassicae]